MTTNNELINKYDEDIYKLEKLNDDLKDILNIQKKINNELTKNICIKNKSTITKKYLPLPYDVNEIIRNKIINDSKVFNDYKILDTYSEYIYIVYVKKLFKKLSSLLIDFYDFNNFDIDSLIFNYLNLFNGFDFVSNIHKFYVENTRDVLGVYNWNMYQGIDILKKLSKKHIDYVKKLDDKFKQKIMKLKQPIRELLKSRITLFLDNTNIIGYNVSDKPIYVKKQPDLIKKNHHGMNKLYVYCLEIFKNYSDLDQEYFYKNISIRQHRPSDNNWSINPYDWSKEIHPMEQDLIEKIINMYKKY